ncbi:hypothetical protein EVAR_10040_1 [Eumeta japonica]|uniref:Uncharacterized protein n=1 Tax=Eumeta variegata TaxID=151549 RepID=A0A4C1TR51_EUMVA|nr:hypothetical protein EVAR_10040_1 [Eumeta japonica]
MDKPTCKLPENKWSLPPMNTRNPRRSHQCIAGILDKNRISSGERNGSIERVWSNRGRREVMDRRECHRNSYLPNERQQGKLLFYIHILAARPGCKTLPNACRAHAQPDPPTDQHFIIQEGISPTENTTRCTLTFPQNTHQFSSSPHTDFRHSRAVNKNKQVSKNSKKIHAHSVKHTNCQAKVKKSARSSAERGQKTRVKLAARAKRGLTTSFLHSCGQELLNCCPATVALV